MENLLNFGSFFIILLILFGAILLLYFVPVRLWITAIFSGVHLKLFRDLVGMRLRRVPPDRIVKPLITAHKAGIPSETPKLEAARVPPPQNDTRTDHDQRRDDDDRYGAGTILGLVFGGNSGSLRSKR